MKNIRDMTYAEVIEEVGQEFVDTVLETEYNQFVGAHKRAAAPSFYPFDCSDEYIDYIESIGHRKVKANYEKLHRMAEEFQIFT